MAGNGRASIAVFVNPRSRANRRNPRLAAEFQAILGDSGRVLAAETLADLDAMAVALRAAPPKLIAVHGGDGTLHRTVTALGRAWGEEPLPPLVLLCGGTMNVVASSLRIADRPTSVLRAVTESLRAGRPPELIRRRCMRIGDKLGFVFGNGLMANFLGEYYAVGSYGPARALWLIARTFFSTLVRGPFARRVFRRFEGSVRVDGEPLAETRFVGVGAATVREVGLGFKLNHRADDDPERFGVLAIHAPPLALVADLRAVHDGRGIAASRAWSGVASTLEVAPDGANGAESDEMSYTIDGDLYSGRGPLRITVGPSVTFVKPPKQLALEASTTRLLAPTEDDTMRTAR